MKGFIKLISLSLLGVCLGIDGFSQDAGNFSNTALQLSNTFPGGSARIRGLGGAQTALGGDISSISSNPAGLGFFNRSEFSFSPNFNYISTSTDYLGQTTDDSKLNFNFANLGVVINQTKGDLVDSKWRGGNFGVSINRIADFHSDVTYEANNTVTDFIDFAVDSDNFGNQNDFSDLAFDTFLTDEFYEIYEGQDSVSINGLNYSVQNLYGNVQNGDSLFFIDRNIYRTDDGSLAFPDQTHPTLQSENISSKGATYQTTVAYGGNYNDKVYFGASIGFLSMNQEVERTYTERPTGADLSSMTLQDNYEINGVGINASFGVIVRPAQPFLIGASYTTPSYYALEQIRTLSMTANYPDFDNEFEEYLFEPFNYSVTTPSKIKGGVTYFFGKNGFITGDIERINYGGANLGNPDSGVNFSDENQTIDKFESVNNYRVGAEYRFDMFRIRGGFAYLEDPTNDNLDQTRQQVNFGAGIRTKDYYVDLGVQSRLDNESEVVPYPTATPASINTDRTNLIFTVGFFF